MIDLKLHNKVSWETHRSGWKYVIDLLEPYNSSQGIITDCFIDATFGFMSSQFIKRKLIPYESEWIGFWHHPPNILPWFDNDNVKPANLIQKDILQSSLPFCRGIFTFSEYLSNYLRSKLNVQIETLYHPTEFTDKTFDFEAFLALKQIIQVGSWQRRLTSFYRFEAPGYSKIHLMGKNSMDHLKIELKSFPKNKYVQSEVNLISHLGNDAYDMMLSKSIVFIDLFDSSVNNTIIECIVRNTPIVVNKIAPVVEYLGEDYPLYYNSIEEVEKKICDEKLLYLTHQYLLEYDFKSKLRGTFFIDSFEKSYIVSSINRNFYSNDNIMTTKETNKMMKEKEALRGSQGINASRNCSI